jgi:hypothetical protein
MPGEYTALRRKQLKDGDMAVEAGRLPGLEDIVDCSPAYKRPGLVYQYGVMMPVFMGRPNM